MVERRYGFTNEGTPTHRKVDIVDIHQETRSFQKVSFTEADVKLAIMSFLAHVDVAAEIGYQPKQLDIAHTEIELKSCGANVEVCLISAEDLREE